MSPMCISELTVRLKHLTGVADPESMILFICGSFSEFMSVG